MEVQILERDLYIKDCHLLALDQKSLVFLFNLLKTHVTSLNVFSGRNSSLSNQNKGMPKQQRGYLFYTNTVIPHKTSQQAHARLATTLDLRHSCINTRPLP